MIEFKGSFYQQSKVDPIGVLVQFDGIILHVWHLSEPFYRLLSSAEFRISPSFSNGCCAIKLPNGDRVETSDSQAINLLSQDRQASSPTPSFAAKHNWALALISSLAILLCTIWLAKIGIRL